MVFELGWGRSGPGEFGATPADVRGGETNLYDEDERDA